MKTLFRLTRGMSAPVLAAAAVATLVCTLPAVAQDGTTHSQRAKHHVATTAGDDSAETLLDGDDARFFLTRVGFAPDNAEVAQYVGLTREQAVDRVLAGARTEASTPVPAWVLEPIPTRINGRPSNARAASVTKNCALGGYARC
jgi:uncharacterized protein (DUF1800 family)